MQFQKVKEYEQRLQRRVVILKRLDKCLLYLQFIIQTIVGISGGITTVLTYNGYYIAVYVINTISPTLVFLSFVLGKIKQSVRTNIQKKNFKRLSSLHTMEFLEKINCEGPELVALTEYYNFKRDLIHYDELYLKPDKKTKTQDSVDDNNNNFLLNQFTTSYTFAYIMRTRFEIKFHFSFNFVNNYLPQ